ncbi:MAG: hypothetical protein EBU23_02885 [Mycobacteriaceae bacterium]|nr:hypothetical protein [Mycobacteriaceae bacterium]
MTASISSALTSVAFISASMRGTDDPGRRRRPRSKAVRAGVVTGRSPMNWVSPSSSRSLRTTISQGGRRLVCTNSGGVFGSIQRAPCNAEADKPATTPRRPDQSQAARARSAVDRSAPRATHTPG